MYRCSIWSLVKEDVSKEGCCPIHRFQLDRHNSPRWFLLSVWWLVVNLPIDVTSMSGLFIVVIPYSITLFKIPFFSFMIKPLSKNGKTVRFYSSPWRLKVHHNGSSSLFSSNFKKTFLGGWQWFSPQDSTSHFIMGVF